MSGLDLYEKTVDENYSRLAPVAQPEASAWDGFARGTALYTMRGFAAAASGIDLLGSVGPTAQDWITGGTEARDKYFKEHEEYWGKAVDYWTPAPGEVGAAGQIAGSLLSTLPMVLANPALAVTTTQTSVAEDLVKKGVDPIKAQAVGATQALGLGIGIYMPILGNNLWQRLLIGGAGFNVVQGAVTRGVSQAILQGTPAAEDFHMLNPQDLTLDALLGMAFGGMAHISPGMRAQGREFWDRVDQWRAGLKPEQIDALATLRQAQHANIDSLPGRPVEAGDINAHVERLRTAVEQLARDEPVNVTDMPKANVTPDEARMTEAQAQAKELTAEANRARAEEGLPKQDDINKALSRPSLTETTYYHGTQIPFEGAFSNEVRRTTNLFTESQGYYFTSYKEDAANYATNRQTGKFGQVIPVALDLKNPYVWPKRGESHTVELSVGKKGEGGPSYISPKDRAALERAGYDGIVYRGGEEAVAFRPEQVRRLDVAGTKAKPSAAAKSAPDPLSVEADRVAIQHPDMLMHVGQDANGNPVTAKLGDFLRRERDAAKQATDDSNLFTVAAECLMGNT